MFSAFSAIVAELSLDFGVLHAALKLHNYMLRAVMRFPLSFFDTTPVGRVLARFSSDMFVVDNDLGEDLFQIVVELLEVWNVLNC